MKEDPELKRRVLSLVTSIGNGMYESFFLFSLCISDNTPTLAEEGSLSKEGIALQMSPSDVADFLTRIQLPQYAQTFKKQEISGELLLAADTEILSELGVTSPLHQMKILHLFQRELEGSVAKYSMDHMSRFLQQYKLEKYSPTMEAHGIDGDMILQVEEKLMKSVLREVGVTSLVDVLKIRKKYKTFVGGDST